MTKILLVGGGGMIGQKIAHQLAESGLPGQTVTKVTLFDLFVPVHGPPHDAAIVGGLNDQALVVQAISDRPDVIILLAAAVSGEAEQDFSMGWRVNTVDMWSFLEAIRMANQADGYCPRVIFASSVAVFGGPLPGVIPDDFHCAPQSSYGNQKVVGEMYISDYSRKGYIDGLSLRLPTITVRPGKANKAASSCFSGIIREPLNGQEAILPLPDTTEHIHASPRAAAGFFRHAATLNTSLLKGVRAITMPGVSCTIAEQISALRAVAGDNVIARIKRVEDPAVAKIVETWPRAFEAKRAHALGFKAEETFAEVLAVYLEDEGIKPRA
ncbi:D-erythronate dehydrogenase [Pseudopelagicola sp. nBUS_19]|uniref:D-erythronate dehydrogenase n=1 Tax=Pseudopelagicola sp. nBUS_19 TaxID=3395316 RepID=UPI003EC07EEB